MTRTVCEVVGMDGDKPIYRHYTTDEIDESDDDQLPLWWRQRELIKYGLLILRCLQGDKAYPISDADVDLLSTVELVALRQEIDGKLKELWESSRERQREREEDSFRLGIQKYRDNLNKRAKHGEALENSPGEAFIQKLAAPLAIVTNQFILESRAGKPGVNAVAANFIQTLDSEVAAYITTRIVLASCFTAGKYPKTLDKLQDEVAKALELEGMAPDIAAALQRRPVALCKEAEDALRKAQTPREGESTVRQLRRQRAAVKKAGLLPPPYYAAHDRDRGGVQMIALLLTVNGDAFQRVTAKFGKKVYSTIAPTPALLEQFRQTHMDRSKLFPVDRPMISIPAHWQTVYGDDGKRKGIAPGGYRYDGKKRRITGPVNMVKTTEPEGLRRIEEFLSVQEEGSGIVIGAINALQSTPFRINRKVFEVMKEVKVAEAYDKYKLPELREPAHTAPYLERSEWWREGRAKASVFLEQYIEAEKSLDEAMIFFPHTLDFRGRAYPMGGPLNPQKDKIARALLEFAEGRRMGENEHARKWLAIHGANCWGLDKESIDERCKWVDDNKQWIIDSAMHPLDCLWWLDADDPWMFLAFCFEWADYLRDGAAHFTHLPVFVDGKANGSQHMAALMRCRATGELVGLCKAGPDERPKDLYQAVADVVNEMIDVDAKAGDPDATRIRQIEDAGEVRPRVPFVNRKMAKGPVMTYGYGITDQGIKDGLSDTFFEWRRDKKISDAQWAILCPKRDPEEKAEGAGPYWKTVTYLADRFVEAVEKVAVASGQVMNWLRASAHILAAEESVKKSGEVERKGLPMAWTTPVGFPVYFAKYNNSKAKRLQCKIYPNATALKKKQKKGLQTIEVSRKYRQEKIALAEMKRGVPPDVIHSLDAAHMMKTIDLCAHKGIRSFAMIHDSYGTHATAMETMSHELRRAFVDMYATTDMQWLSKELTDSARILVPDRIDLDKLKLPDIKEIDSLDINEVLTATYFFS